MKIQLDLVAVCDCGTHVPVEGNVIRVRCPDCEKARRAPQPPDSPPSPDKGLFGDLCTVEEIVAETPFTLAMLRTLLYRREENGLAPAVTKLGKRLYFRRSLFAEWLEGHFTDKAG